MPISERVRAATGIAKELRGTARRFRQQAVFHAPQPPATGLVLDIGAGHAPHPRCDVVVDKYVADDFERAGAIDVVNPLVVGDGHQLPFANDTFSYVIASHVLEHATDVHQFAAEFARVGAAGFVQVPSRESELTFGWPFHPWLIDLRDGVLVFEPRADQAAPFGEIFHEAAGESVLFRVWMGAHRDRWHHTVHWTGQLPVEVAGDSQAPQTAALDVEHTLATLPRLGAQGPVGAIRAALRCPIDRGELRDQAGRLVCAECQRAYPVAGNVPVLLPEAAT